MADGITVHGASAIRGASALACKLRDRVCFASAEQTELDAHPARTSPAYDAGDGEGGPLARQRHMHDDFGGKRGRKSCLDKHSTYRKVLRAARKALRRGAK